MSRGSDEGAGQKVEEDIQWLRVRHANVPARNILLTPAPLYF